MSQPRLAPRDRALSYPRVTQDQKTRRAGKDAPRGKLKVERWREENPDHFCTWETKYGCVIQFWGMRVYYGRCKEEGCNGLVTTRRSIQGEHEYKFKTGRTMLGAYPSLCDNCRKRKQKESYTKNRKYAANYRRKLYERRGRPPHQGKPGPMAGEAREERWKREFDHYELFHNPEIHGEEADWCYDPKCPDNKRGENCNA